jgi:alpha-tubulin suppressor-like RCC1 family protein
MIILNLEVRIHLIELTFLDSTTSASAAGVFVSGDVGNVFAGDKVLDLVAGTQFSVVLTSTGQLYAWGQNTYGE